MNSGKAILSYFIGIILFVIACIFSVIVLAILLSIFPFIENLFALSFGDFLYGIAVYGLGFFTCLKIIDILSVKWDFEPCGVLSAMGVTILVFEAICIVLNLINGSPIHSNIIAIFFGAAFIFSGRM